MKPLLAWTLGTVALMAVCLVILAIRDRNISEESYEPRFAAAVESVTFQDGSMIEIIQIGEESLTDTNLASVPDTPFWMGGGSSSSSGSSGGIGELSTSYERRDGVLRTMEFSTNKGALLVELKMIDQNGDSYPPTALYADRRVWRCTGNSQSSMGEFAGADSMIANEKDIKHPEILFQVADSDGNWRSGDGPATCDESPDHRGAVSFNVWPRNAADLKFRAIRPGMEPMEFTLANPSITTKPAVWKSVALPATHTDPEFELTLDSVESTTVDGASGYLKPKVQVKSTLTMDGKVIEDAFNRYITGVEGNFGSQSFDWSPGYPVDPSETQLRIHCSVTPSDSYPYNIADALVVGTFEVDQSGKPGEIEVDKKSKTGINTIKVSQHSESLKIEFEGVWNNPSEEADFEHVTGGWHLTQLAVLADDEQWTQQTTSSSSGGSSGSNYRTEFNRSFHLQSTDPLTPGQKFSIVFFQQPAPKKVTFTIDRSSVTEE